MTALHVGIALIATAIAIAVYYARHTDLLERP